MDDKILEELSSINKKLDILIKLLNNKNNSPINYEKNDIAKEVQARIAEAKIKATERFNTFGV